MNDCFLCTSPVPISQEDANLAFLGGIVEGMRMLMQGRAIHLCTVHRGTLRGMLAKTGMTVVFDDELPLSTPDTNSN